MTLIKTTFGYFLAGIITSIFWNFLTKTWGLFGGWLAAPLLLTPLWYINHRKGLIHHSKEAVFIDMALAIGLTAWIRSMIQNDINALLISLPTLITVSIAGVSAGAFVAHMNRLWEKIK